MFNTFLQNSTQQTLSNYKEDVKRINVLEKQLQGKTEAQLQEIAATKLPDLNTKNIEMAMRIVAGTAKNMGIKVEA